MAIPFHSQYFKKTSRSSIPIAIPLYITIIFHRFIFQRNIRFRKSLIDFIFQAMSSGRCAACRFLRRKCTEDCVLSPYFPSNNPQRFVSVHRIYGASNVTKLLQRLPTHLRAEAADSLYFEAQCRVEDPVYGCVGHIFYLQQQIQSAEIQLVKTRAEIAVIKSQAQQFETETKAKAEAEDEYNNLLLQQLDNDAGDNFPAFI